MSFGRAFCRIQEISLLVSAGDTRVAVSPAARTPSERGGMARQFGSWTRTMGAICGLAHVAVGGNVCNSSGSRPCLLCRAAAMVRASRLNLPLVRPRSFVAHNHQRSVSRSSPIMEGGQLIYDCLPVVSSTKRSLSSSTRGTHWWAGVDALSFSNGLLKSQSNSPVGAMSWAEPD